MNSLLKNPKTSLGALLVAVGGVGTQITPDQTWTTILVSIGAVIMGVCARDSDVSSEEAGAEGGGD